MCPGSCQPLPINLEVACMVVKKYGSVRSKLVDWRLGNVPATYLSDPLIPRRRDDGWLSLSTNKARSSLDPGETLFPYLALLATPTKSYR